MRNGLVVAVVVAAFIAGVAIGHPGHLTPVAHAQDTGLVDPVLIVHQGVNGGPISVYLSHDPAVVAQVQSTPDGGCNRTDTTCYVEGSPGLTESVTTITDMLYKGLNPAPPKH